MKVTIIGAGNVGATCANLLAQKNIVREIILIDIKKDVALGKALDIWQSASILSFSTKIKSSDQYEQTKDSQIVVITSGVTRKKGESREDLIRSNAKIVNSVMQNALKYSPEAIFIIVSNPLDLMSYVAYKCAKKFNPSISHHRIIGMAGTLDVARYKAFLALELNCSPNDIQALLLGSHGDTMVPLIRYTTLLSIPISELLQKDKLEVIIERTKKGGGELVSLLGTSAWYAPGASIVEIIEAIIKDSKKAISCSVWLDGEYGMKSIYLGVPVIVGEKGIEKIIELNLNEKEMYLLKSSGNSIKENIKKIEEMNLF